MHNSCRRDLEFKRQREKNGIRRPESRGQQCWNGKTIGLITTICDGNGKDHRSCHNQPKTLKNSFPELRVGENKTAEDTTSVLSVCLMRGSGPSVSPSTHTQPLSSRQWHCSLYHRRLGRASEACAPAACGCLVEDQHMHGIHSPYSPVA